MTAERRNHRWAFRVSSSSDELVREAATLEGVSMTSFVEESAVERARSVIAEHESVMLGPVEFARFAAALDGAPREIPELVELFRRPDLIPQT